MDSLIISIITLILSASGFLTYRQPVLTRKIVVVLLVLVGTVSASTLVFLKWNIVEINNILHGEDVLLVRDLKIDASQLDSFRTSSHNNNMSNVFLKVDSGYSMNDPRHHDNEIRLEGYYEAMKTVYNASGKTIVEIKNYIIYEFVGVGILLVFFILTYVFNKLWQDETNKNNKKPSRNSHKSR